MPERLPRPNIRMFSDGGWQADRTEEQEGRHMHRLNPVKRLVIIEIGAGTSISTARHFGNFQDGFLIRINPGEPDLPAGAGSGRPHGTVRPRLPASG